MKCAIMASATAAAGTCTIHRGIQYTCIEHVTQQLTGNLNQQLDKLISNS